MALLLILLLIVPIGVVDGHGYMYSPRSLNWRANQDGIEWGQQVGETIKEYCPHCLNVKQPHEVCGNSGTKNYDNFLDSRGLPMPWQSEDTYVEGQVIQIKSHLAAHHYGHAELSACANWENPTQQCFDENILTYVYDPGFAYGAPANPSHPQYGHYADTSKTNYTHKFQLPRGVFGDKVLLQWRYVTANSCNPPGYLDYPWPHSTWWSGPFLGDCDPPPYPPDGSRPAGAPEQFWNCAQVTIERNSVPTVSPGPSETSTDAPTKAPVPVSDQIATSTRYWDCAGGSCGCAYLPTHLSGNQNYPAHCYSNALFQAPPNNIHGAKFYGTAAVSRALGGDNWLGGGCGKCWKLTGTCNTPGCTAGESTLVVRGANFCPPEAMHCDSGPHFDIAAPGFDVNGYSLSNDCKNLEPKESVGFEACSKWMIDVQDPNVNCDCHRFENDVLRKGCENFVSLGWDNPVLNYEEITCPDEMVTPCWEDNGNKYPPFMQTPETCLSPSRDNSPTTEPGPSPAPVPVGPTPPASNTATTTRYWDCSGGTCGCSYVPNGLDNPGEPAYCYSNAMFEAPVDNVHGAKYYGTAAISYHLGGGDWMNEGCGKCWRVTGSANIMKYQEVGETTMVIKGTNYCPPSNPLCDAGPHFDIAAPGFDVLKYSFSNTCDDREPDELDGFRACGNWMIDDQDPDINCDCSKFNNQILKKGCENFYALKWDNADVVYEELDECPDELSSLHCDYPYPDEDDMPITCASNTFEPPEPGGPTQAPVASPTLSCPAGWKSASWTWYQSYAPCCPESPNYDPEYPTTECDLYSACSYTGQFAYAGQREYDWVNKTDLIAFFSSNGDNESYGNKKIKIKANGKTVKAWIVDTCGDGDCNGCCTENANNDGYLVDMESHTVERYFSNLDAAKGEVCWKLDNSPLTGYCSWYQCNGEIQDDPYCNFDSHNCLGVCSGLFYCPVDGTASPNTSPPSKDPTISPVKYTPVPTTSSPSKIPTTSPVKYTPVPTTSSPSKIPTTSPSSKCPGQHDLVVEFKTDEKPQHNKYWLYYQKNNRWRKKFTNFGFEANQLNIYSHCIDRLKCYKFKIIDRRNDGVDGWYRLLLDGILIKEGIGWKRGKKQEHIFGTCTRPE